MYFVYVLRNPEGRLYIGSTADLERRLFEHQHGLAHWTSSRGPWQLLYREELPSRSEAMQREKALKSGQGWAWLRAQFAARAGPPQAD